MKNRNLNSLAPLFKESRDFKSNSIIIFNSSSDIGVRRNFGRNGARYAPKAIVNSLKKFNKQQIDCPLHCFEVSDQVKEEQNFHQAQIAESELIKELIDKSKNENYIHLGGGHDHAFALLHAINESKKFKNLLIINIDAHCDTRIEDQRHSGTPFRDFDNIAQIPYHLIQYGIQGFANSPSTLKPVENGSSSYYYLNEIVGSKENDLLETLKNKTDSDTAIFFSLDCDAISGDQMKAVSAVNGRGLSLEHIHNLLKEVLELECNALFFGVYEYNPVYDDLSQLGSRSIATLLYEYLNKTCKK